MFLVGVTLGIVATALYARSARRYLAARGAAAEVETAP
jgi:hypothetical protein